MKMKTLIACLGVAFVGLVIAHNALGAQPADPDLAALKAEIAAMQEANKELEAKIERLKLIARKQAVIARRAKLEAEQAKLAGGEK